MISCKTLHKNVIKAGGIDRTNRGEKKLGHFRADYGPVYLWWIDGDVDGKKYYNLSIAWKFSFDRWANSRSYDGPPPQSVLELDWLISVMLQNPKDATVHVKPRGAKGVVFYHQMVEVDSKTFVSYPHVDNCKF